MLILVALALWFQTAAAPVQIPPDVQPACVYQGMLPDPACTPGAGLPIALDVLCVRGYTTTVRPPTTYTTPLKRRLMAAYGVGDQPLSAFELDHLVPLEIGGDPTDPANLWPERLSDARLKDQVENAARRAVCRGELDLTDAQTMMATDWTDLGRLLGVLQETP